MRTTGQRVGAALAAPALHRLVMEHEAMTFALDDRLCFMHLPKTAGTTLKAYLSDMYHLRTICPAFEHVALNELTEAGRLQEYKLFQGHFSYHQLPQHIKDGCKFLTVLRHPLPRVISEYYQWSRRPEFFTPEIKALLLRSHNAQTLMLSPLPQEDDRTPMQEHLAAAKALLESYVFVGIQERFTEGMRSLAAILHRPMPVEVPRLNVGRNKQQRIPDRSEAEILAANWADLELYAFASALYERKFALMHVPAPGEYSSTERYSGVTQGSVRQRMEQPLIGDGWYEREGVGSDAPALWRWTGPGTEAYVDFAFTGAGDHTLSLHVLNAASPDTLHGMQVQVNGAPVSLVERLPTWWDRLRGKPAPGGWQFTARIPGALLRSDRPYVRITLVVPATLRQCDADPNTDAERPIGLAITEICLTAV